MNSIDKLSEVFSHFPGIGPRQAKRFVYFLLSRNRNLRESLARAILDLERDITQCDECRRFFPQNDRPTKLCSICSDTSRDRSMLMIVPRDIDLEAVEKSGTFKGLYFVLGGSLPILEKEPEKRIRLSELKKSIDNKRSEIKEVILAMNANSEGENTADFLKDVLSPILPGVPLTILGRGLSSGAELEYADPETLKNAFLHRTK